MVDTNRKMIGKRRASQRNAFPLLLRALVSALMRAHLNRTSRGHQLPSSPSLRQCSHGARLQHSEGGHPIELWEAETEVRKSTGEEKFNLQREQILWKLVQSIKNARENVQYITEVQSWQHGERC